MKILLLFLLFSLVSCESKNTTDTVYVASMTIEKNNNVYNASFYIPSSIEVGSEKTKSDAKGKIGNTSADNIVDLFYEISLTSSLKINYAHISTLILHESVLNYEDIYKLTEFFKNTNRFDYNFYILSTNISSKDLYSLSSSNNEALITTILTNPQNVLDLFVSTPPLHYLNLCRDFYDNKVCKLPLIELKEIWKLEDKINSYMARGITFISKDKTKVYSYKELDYRYFNSTKGLFYSQNDISFTIINYDISVKYKDKIIVVIKGKVENYDKSKNINYEEIIKENLSLIINKLTNEIDFLNIEYYKLINDKNYNIDDIEYKFNLK